MKVPIPFKGSQILLSGLLFLAVHPDTFASGQEETPAVEQEVFIVGLPQLPADARPMRLIRIPAGSFLMGSTDTERGRESDETPVHRVTFLTDFFMGETEVTQAQWRALKGTLPSSIPGESGGEGKDFPVYDVSWHDAQEFIEALNALDVGTFRLPSEAEWEYACRAGAEAAFFFGDSSGCGLICEDCEAGGLPGKRSDYMWFCGASSRDAPTTGPPQTASLRPNPFGLYDMSGSVFEWCEDWYHPSYVNAPDDGRAWITPKTYGRILRGGHYGTPARFCRSADRGMAFPAERNAAFGLRVVKDP